MTGPKLTNQLLETGKRRKNGDILTFSPNENAQRKRPYARQIERRHAVFVITSSIEETRRSRYSIKTVITGRLSS
jgi:hypothetical protein